jgi:hypothetical protein
MCFEPMYLIYTLTLRLIIANIGNNHKPTLKEIVSKIVFA